MTETNTDEEVSLISLTASKKRTISKNMLMHFIHFKTYYYFTVGINGINRKMNKQYSVHLEI